MKSRAAVAFGAGQPLEIVEVDLDGPRAGEVLVEIKATGVCHTDAFTLSGDDPEGAFPAILGHEGAGVVVETGPGVSSVSAGDTVRWVIGDTMSGAGETGRAHVLVKPIAEDLSTNLVIITDRRAYHLELTSTADTYMAAVSWRYPQDELLILQRTDPPAGQAPQTSSPSSLNVEDLRFRYALSGDRPPWRPARVFDDTQKVYIQFPERLDQGEAPPLFVVGADGGNQEARAKAAPVLKRNVPSPKVIRAPGRWERTAKLDVPATFRLAGSVGKLTPCCRLAGKRLRPLPSLPGRPR